MRMLLIEDNLQMGQALFRALKADDYQVDWVRDARAGRLAIDAAYYAVECSLKSCCMHVCPREGGQGAFAFCYPNNPLMPCASKEIDFGFIDARAA
ncbi:hypothetical protein AWB76_05756 [Caballeronia temeraria]|uniref:Uncharacterized protein n=1 Tax=Caballeronia temeraria TaxID=1777137 RepID=A0A158CMI3_9BURK|nr:hypothetical protein AWB76_05756 [Caballeronia temeraria]